MESRPLFRAIIRTVGEGGRATRRARHRGRRKAESVRGGGRHGMGWYGGRGHEKWKEEVDRRRRLGATVAARGRIDLIPRHEKCPPV